MRLTNEHIPVLLRESTDLLVTNPAGVYVDATFGRGGHSKVILEKLNSNGRLVALDQDADAIRVADELARHDQRLIVNRSNFEGLLTLIEQLELIGDVDGLLLDLGVSSPQLDNPQRGFSFQSDGPLDMRMDRDSGESAADWLSRVSEPELSTVLRDFGEERYARRIARALVESRQHRAITTTAQLAEIVKAAHPNWQKHHHPATRTFQAIRIAVNRELDVLAAVLRQARDIIRVGGRLVVISFHSLEDRLVKREIRGKSTVSRTESGVELPRQPGFWRAVGKAVFAPADEVSGNPRARSAVLRVAERLAPVEQR